MHCGVLVSKMSAGGVTYTMELTPLGREEISQGSVAVMVHEFISEVPFVPMR